MKQIRRGVFETNSSSTHSITMCSNEDYQQWRNGELFLLKDGWSTESESKKKDFVTIDELRDILAKCRYFNEDINVIQNNDIYGKCKDVSIEVYTYDDYWNDEYLEGYDSEFTTHNGETVIAFGKYGYDG